MGTKAADASNKRASLRLVGNLPVQKNVVQRVRPFASFWSPLSSQAESVVCTTANHAIGELYLLDSNALPAWTKN